MNGRTMPMERVPFSEAEKEYLGPIFDRYEQVQRDIQEVQKSMDAVVKLFMAQHKEELTEGPEWQLGRDAFVRPLLPPQPIPDVPPPVGQEDEINGSVDAELAQMMR